MSPYSIEPVALLTTSKLPTSSSRNFEPQYFSCPLKQEASEVKSELRRKWRNVQKPKLESSSISNRSTDPLRFKYFSKLGIKQKLLSPLNYNADKGPRRVHFNDNINIVPVPSRGSYSKQMKSQLWCTTSENQKNIARNTVEFASERWDWRAVLEESQMIRCARTGEKVHPIHAYCLSNRCINNRQPKGTFIKFSTRVAMEKSFLLN